MGKPFFDCLDLSKALCPAKRELKKIRH